HVVDGHADGGVRLAEPNGEVVASEPVDGERRVGARLRRDAAEDVVARVGGGPTRGATVQVLAGDVEESAAADAEAVVDLGLDLVAVVPVGDVPKALVSGRRAGRRGQLHPVGLLLQHDVDHAGD